MRSVNSSASIQSRFNPTTAFSRALLSFVPVPAVRLRVDFYKKLLEFLTNLIWAGDSTSLLQHTFTTVLVLLAIYVLCHRWRITGPCCFQCHLHHNTDLYYSSCNCVNCYLMTPPLALFQLQPVARKSEILAILPLGYTPAFTTPGLNFDICQLSHLSLSFIKPMKIYRLY